MAQLHQLARNIPNKKKKIIGRGGKRGTYSGAGTKGQKSRAGGKLRPELRDIIKKLPKKRGYRFSPLKKNLVIPVNIKDIESAVVKRNMSHEVSINPGTLVSMGVVKNLKNGLLVFKILGMGEAKRKYKVSGCMISESAKAKIISAGGHVAL